MGDRDRAWVLVKEVLRREQEAVSPLGDNRIVMLADGIYQTTANKEVVRQVLGDCPPQPGLHENYITEEQGLGAFNHRFRLNRLLTALGDESNLTNIVPDPENVGRQGMAYFERAVCIIAKIWGKAWGGLRLDGSTIVQESFPILALFRQRHNNDWIPSIGSHGIWGELFALLVSAVEQHGREALDSLRESFIQEWGGEAKSCEPTWPADVQRKVVLALWRSNGAQREWVVGQLQRLEHRMLAGHDPRERISESQQQAVAWQTVGDGVAARKMLEETLHVSVAIGDGDYQLNSWIRWLGRANEIAPEQAPERIEWFSRAVAAIEETGGPAPEAAQELLEITFKWSPRRAVKLFHWFLSKRLIRYEDGLRTLLRSALESPEPPLKFVRSTTANVVFPISGADEKLIQRLLTKTSHHGENEALDLARYLVSLADISVLRSTRPGWQRGIARGLQEAGIDYRNAGLASDILQPQEGSQSKFDELRTTSKRLAELGDTQRAWTLGAFSVSVVEPKRMGSPSRWWDAH